MNIRFLATLISLTAVAAVRAVPPDIWLTVRYDVRMEFGVAREKKMPTPIPIEVRAPAYPASMMIEETEGEVVVDFTVSSEGRVRELVLVTSSHSACEAVVRDAVQGWKFKAVPSSIRMRCKIRFAIYEKEEPNQSPEPMPLKRQGSP